MLPLQCDRWRGHRSLRVRPLETTKFLFFLYKDVARRAKGRRQSDPVRPHTSWRLEVSMPIPGWKLFVDSYRKPPRPFPGQTGISIEAEHLYEKATVVQVDSFRVDDITGQSLPILRV
jgi:hypothetical protein